MDISKMTAQMPGTTSLAKETRDSETQEVSISDKVAIEGGIPSKDMLQDIRKLRQMTGVKRISRPPELGSKEYWVSQARHMTDFFAGVSKDDEAGGFYTHIDSMGKVSNENEKFLMPTSRQVWAYSAAYLMTGDGKYLELAERGVDFILKHHMREAKQDEVYWAQQTDRKGNPTEVADRNPLVINEQTYGLTGLIEYYKATRDKKILDVIRKGHEFITNHFHDERNGGFFDSVNPLTFEPTRTKSYNSTVYPATSALLEIADIAEGDWKKQVFAQIKELSFLFMENFPDSRTGFIKENFTENWEEDWRGWQKQPEGTIGVTGHNAQGALFLLRAERLLSGEGLLSPEESSKYRETAKAVLDGILEKGYDKLRGGWYDVFVRETGKKDRKRSNA
ncbi:MAG: AGE family epimerase/isomerase [Armatimonadetes bacterium]|nr:AGE family epimerase/isomerase [Armatimonadota bacterium]